MPSLQYKRESRGHATRPFSATKIIGSGKRGQRARYVAQDGDDGLPRLVCQETEARRQRQGAVAALEGVGWLILFNSRCYSFCSLILHFLTPLSAAINYYSFPLTFPPPDKLNFCFCLIFLSVCPRSVNKNNYHLQT